ncbi:hypothetical protein [Aeromonas caviae]|uniref:hypothetical protein n=1 Tax=Aeromonas caviae TaxID=648 RepID=UPI0030DB449E
MAIPSSGGRLERAGPAGTRDPGRVPGAVPGRPGAPLAIPSSGGRPQGAGPSWYPRSGAGAWCGTWLPWSALGQPDHRRPPPGGPGLPVPEIRGVCLVQYLVALERPWPTRAPAAAPRGGSDAM